MQRRMDGAGCSTVLITALLVKELDAVVLAVRDEDQPVTVAADIMREVEVATVCADSPQENRCRPSGAYLWTRAFP